MTGQPDAPTVPGVDVATLSDGPPSTPSGGDNHSPDSMIGREILGQYRILSRLGRGGMGTVFLAAQAGMERQVAIKVLNAEVSADPSAARRFQQEAQAAARLSSPHIVSVYNFGRLETGELYLAMEYLQGRTLHGELAMHGPMSVPRVVELVIQIARGLDEAHRNGVVHRDLKPSNVMLVSRPQGELATLLDFGIAKLDTGSSTRTRGWVGTPRYMAPEQFTGAPVDARTDVYALGLIAYELLCGRTPFLSDNPMSYVHSHVYSPVPSMGSVSSTSVPLSVENAVLSALAKDPAQRPATAGSFAEALVRGAHGAPTAAKRSSVGPAIAAALLGLGLVGGAATYAYLRWSAADATETTANTENPVEVAVGTTPSETNAGPAFDPTYLARLPPEFRGLVDETEEALLARLDATIEAYPPSSRTQVKAQYALQLAAMPGTENATNRKVLLINAIVAMASVERSMPNDPRTTEQLVEAYLSRPGPVPRATRQQVLETMRANVPNPEDADWTVRTWLIQLEKQDAKAAPQGTSPKFIQR